MTGRSESALTLRPLTAIYFWHHPHTTPHTIFTFPYNIDYFFFTLSNLFLQMSQPRARRLSTARYTQRPPPDPTKDPKSPLQQANSHLAAFMKESKPHSRPPMLPRDQKAKSAPKESFAKGAVKPSEEDPVMESPPVDAKGMDARATKFMHSVKSVTSDKVRGIPINISLPSNVERRRDADLKDLMPSQSFDDVESTSKADMPLSPEGFITPAFDRFDHRFCLFDRNGGIVSHPTRRRCCIGSHVSYR